MASTGHHSPWPTSHSDGGDPLDGRVIRSVARNLLRPGLDVLGVAVPLGPFEISAERVESLGGRFTQFVNKLLELETSAQGMRGHQLAVTSNESTPDGGVDASLRGSIGSDFLPSGNSAWQFKRSGFGPTACAAELSGATWAHEFVRSGGSYVIVIGAALPDNLIERRRVSVVAKAIDLGLITEDDASRIRVYDANKLARWASRFPALAVSRLAGGPGSAAIDFDTWAAGRTHDKTWVSDDPRDGAMNAIRAQVASSGIIEIRVQGEPGVGKTRMVLEALRDPAISPLVAYVADERAVGGELLTHLISEDRVAILVVDECPAERHVKLVERLPADPAIRLITIGDTGPAATRTPVVGLTGVTADVTEEFLKLNYRSLRSESRRFVADHSRGNMRWTIVLADRVSGVSDAQAADIIARNDIEHFVATILPEGRDFFFSAILALLERVGCDGEKRYQLKTLADFVGVSAEDLDVVAAELEQRGLLVRQGRYRAVTPHPLSVYLAAEAWKTYGRRLVSELLPRLDPDMALAFFRRVADLGRFEPARSVLPQLLSTTGPFSTLDALEAGGLGKMLTQLAIVLPEEVALHLAELIDQADLDTLCAQRSSRRDLVWTLEKLVWHSRTFEIAANSLLKLALAENETFSNNASGTWVDLFGTMLPGTAASPAERAAYLRKVSASRDPAVRTIAVIAAAKSLVTHESISVSGELQSGVLVEPRGTPTTWEEAGTYRRAMIELLKIATRDEDSTVASKAEDALIAAAAPVLGDWFAGEALADALCHLGGDGLRRLRARAEHLISLYDRHNSPNQLIREKLVALLERLPDPSLEERVQVLLRLNRWDFDDGELQSRIERTLRGLSDAEARRRLLRSALAEDLPAAWELGNAIAAIDGKSDEALSALVDAFSVSPSAIVGYLSGLQTAGHATAIEDFLDGDLAARLTTRDRLSIAVRGPVTEESRARIFAGINELGVAEAIFLLLGWYRNMSEDEIAGVIHGLIKEASSQEDYNALVQWLSFVVHPGGSMPASVADDAWQVVTLRRKYPELSQQSWDWAQLAQAFMSEHSLEIGRIILDLIDSDQIMIADDDREAELLGKAAEMHPRAIWDDVARRLEAASWRLEVELRGWFLLHIPSDAVEEWVGLDVQRARIVASLTPIGGDEPAEVTRFLLANFYNDRRVASSLYSSLVSGFWTGQESDRIARQIEQLKGWRRRTTEPAGVREWARLTLEHLEASRDAALQREAEGY